MHTITILLPYYHRTVGLPRPSASWRYVCGRQCVPHHRWHSASTERTRASAYNRRRLAQSEYRYIAFYTTVQFTLKQSTVQSGTEQHIRTFFVVPAYSIFILPSLCILYSRTLSVLFSIMSSFSLWYIIIIMIIMLCQFIFFEGEKTNNNFI